MGAINGHSSNFMNKQNIMLLGLVRQSLAEPLSSIDVAKPNSGVSSSNCINDMSGWSPISKTESCGSIKVFLGDPESIRFLRRHVPFLI